MASTDSRVLTAHVPAPLAAKVDHLAQRLDRSRGWVVEQALVAWVEQEEERHRLTLEGLADVKAGKVVDHAEVKAWAESLATASPLPLPGRGSSGRARRLATLPAFMHFWSM